MNPVHKEMVQINPKSIGFKEKSLRSASTISYCLEKIKESIRRESKLLAILESWENLAGEQLAQNCIPLRLQQETLFIGAEHPQWRQALIYNRIKLLSSIKSAGHKVKEIKIQQYHPQKRAQRSKEELTNWKKHPSRIDVHGIAECTSCGNPAPVGEMALWGYCSLCRRNYLK